MNREKLLSSVCFFVCALTWGYVAYSDYIESPLEIPYIEVVLTLGFLVLGVVAFYTARKNR